MYSLYRIYALGEIIDGAKFENPKTSNSQNDVYDRADFSHHADPSAHHVSGYEALSTSRFMPANPNAEAMFSSPNSAP